MNRSKCSLLAGDECVPLRQALDRVAELETERDALVKGMEDWARQCAEAHGVLLKMESWAAQAEAVRVAAEAMVAIFGEMAPDDRFAPPRTPELNRELLEWVRDRRERLDAATRKVGRALSACPPLAEATDKPALAAEDHGKEMEDHHA